MRAGDAVTIGPPMRLWRVYRQGGAYPSGWSDFRFDGPTGSRFDHHVPPRRHQDRGILYAASQRSTDAAALNSALAEVFQDTRTIDPYDRSPWLAGFVVTATLRLLDLGSGWVTRAGGNAALTSGGRRVAQEWSRMIDGDVDVDGLWYPCATYPPDGPLRCTSVPPSKCRRIRCSTDRCPTPGCGCRCAMLARTSATTSSSDVALQ
jgi:hypothetical protein